MTGSESEPWSCEPHIVVVEGLDGVGKSSVADELVLATGGVNVTRLAARTAAAARPELKPGRYSAHTRYYYWLWVNAMTGELAREAISRGQVAVIDSYVFRTIATHLILGISGDEALALMSVAPPDRVALLTLDEDLRLARVRSRDNDQESLWHALLRDRHDEVLSAYRKFELAEVDARQTPAEIARAILRDDAFLYFDRDY
jgi:thymidylate kinase